MPNGEKLGYGPAEEAKARFPLGRNIFAPAKEAEISTVALSWPRPGSSEAIPKEAYVTRVGNQGCAVVRHTQIRREIPR